jgi:hypothetical protein
VGIVDSQHERLSDGVSGQLLGASLKQMQPFVDVLLMRLRRAGKQCGEYAERDLGAGTGRRNPGDGETRLPAHLERFETESALADAYRASEYDALPAVDQDVLECAQFPASADQGPLRAHGLSVRPVTVPTLAH